MKFALPGCGQIPRLSLLLLAGLTAAGASTARGATYDYFLAQARTNPNLQIRLADNNEPGGSQARTYGNTAGGEFRVEMRFGPGDYQQIEYSPAGGDGATPTWAYKTFCVEMGETINPHAGGSDGFGEYYVTINDAAWFGFTLEDGPSPDVLDVETKVLYGLYFENKLAAATGLYESYMDGDTSLSEANDWANALQKVIWKLEGETSVSLGGAKELGLWNWISNPLNVAAYDQDYIDHVQVLNLWSQNIGTPGPEDMNFRQQSQLVFVHAPAPGAIVIWAGLLGCGAIGSIWRRRALRSVI